MKKTSGRCGKVYRAPAGGYHMKHAKTAAIAATAGILALGLALTGCSTGGTVEAVYVTSISQSTAADGSTQYTVFYSDGTSTTLSGAAGSDENTNVARDAYEAYLEETGEDITYTEFLKTFLSADDDSNAQAVAACLNSTLKIYAESVVTQSSFNPFWGTTSVSDLSIMTGSAVVYRIDEESDTAYLVTNYHVVYNEDADTQKNGGTIARAVYGYLYGSEGAPTPVDENGDGRADTDSDGYTKYDYGDSAVAFTYVGGSMENDIAVLKGSLSALRALNPDVKAVTLADGYYVGETAIAIGNPEDGGLSVTQGIISTEYEQIQLEMGGVVRSYRTLRIDTPLYSGNSGGGLFNLDGELIGITNAGNKTDQNINYAVPLDLVTGVADNILYYANDGDDSTNGAYRITLGLSVTADSSRYVYDAATGYGHIEEVVTVSSVSAGTIAGKLELAEGDRIDALVVNGTEYGVSRTFHIYDILLTVRAGDSIRIRYERDGSLQMTDSYAVSTADLSPIT